MDPSRPRRHRLMRHRRDHARISAATLRIALACALSASGHVPLLAQAAPAGEGGLTYGEVPGIRRLNPYATVGRNGPTDRFLTMIYEPLFRYNYSLNEWEPVLATGRIEAVRPRSRTAVSAVAVELKPNVRWHDGSPFTAEDVVHTYNYILATGGGTMQRQFYDSQLDNVRADGRTRVVFELRQRVAQPRLLLREWIIPRKAFDDRMSPISDALNLDRHPLGTGPFRFDTIVDPVFRVTANPRYHGSPVTLGSIAARGIADEQTRVGTLFDASRGTQLVVDIAPELLSLIEGQGGARYRIEQLETYNAYVVAFRQRPGSLLANERVRLALTMAVNRELVVSNYFPQGTVLPSAVVPNAPFYNEALRPVPFDRAGAQRLLQQAGVAAPRPLVFIWPREPGASGDRTRGVAAAIIEAFKQVGVPVRERVVLPEDYHRELQRGDFDLAWIRWEFDPAYDISQVFHSKNIPGAGNPDGRNIMRFSDPAVDSLFDAYRTTTDRGQQQQLMYRAQELLRQKAPALFLTNEVRSYAYRTSFEIARDLVDAFYFFTYAGQWRARW